MLKRFYQGFLEANPGVQHYACHSHHYWPDVTREAMLQYWDDSARLVDAKWQYMFGVKVPQVQQRISQLLHIKQPQQIVFANNTHELLFRLLSCFDWHQPLVILTTDSEFHSFQRQAQRLAELPQVQLIQVPTEPYADFPERLVQAALKHQPQLIFFSQVFFNSGVSVGPLEPLVTALEQACSATIAIDGYHGFMAIPTDLSTLEGRIFYVAGSYKYAQAGEGCCFMLIPAGCSFRPLYTGWFAEFGQLAAARVDEVAYADDGYRFAGATMDLSALYRLESVLRLLQQQQIEIEAIHQHVQRLQQHFLHELEQWQHPWLNREHWLHEPSREHGHFLTFQGPSSEAVAELAAFLQQHHIHADYRQDRLRFGFAPYHELEDIQLACLGMLE